MTLLFLIPFFILMSVTEDVFVSFSFGVLLILLFLSSAIGAIITIIILIIALLHWLAKYN
ncbi:MAG: hypothetical protein PWP67_2888 [Clostridium butyricum]|nr:hypothetical protein [Clostridium butyricum]